MGYFPTKIVSEHSGKSDPRPRGMVERVIGGSPRREDQKARFGERLLSSRKVSAKGLAAFTRQLATLVKAGLPLVRGLRALEHDQKNWTLKQTINQITEAIEGGSTFSEALTQHPKIFNHLYVSMIQAGEVSGALESVLNRLAETMEKSERIKGKIKGAMAYPCAVMTIAAIILGCLMAWVIPQFEAMFKELLPGKELPAFTQIVLGISRGAKNHLPWIVAGLVLLGAGAHLGKRFTLARRALDRVKLHIPALGELIGKVAIARFSRTLGTLLGSGVPILQALSIVREASGNSVVSDAVAQIHTRVKEGDTIAEPMEISGIFPSAVISMVDVGEQTGALPDMLDRIAESYDEEVDNSVAALTALLEPCMIVFLAGVVGSMVIALFLPILEIMQGPEGPGGAGRPADTTD
jgi:type IV pilus assembly protein PilC